MGTWQIVTSSWRLVLKGLPIVGIVAAINLAFSLSALPLAEQVDTPSGTAIVLGLLLVLAQFFILPMIQGGSLGFAVHATSAGAADPIASFKDGVKRLYRRLLGFEALTAAAGILLLLGTMLLFGIALLPSEQVPALSIALILLVSAPVAIALYAILVVTAFAPASMAVDNAAVFAAVKNAWSIGRRLVGKLLLTSILLVVTLLPAIAVVVGVGLLLGDAPGLGGQILSLILQSVITGMSLVLFALAFVQLFRQRPA